MKEPKIEIKYSIPEIDININKKNQQNFPEPINELFEQFEDIEDNYYNSKILSEISESKLRINQQSKNIMNSSLMLHQGIKCEKCQTLPIIGHRYKCPKCLNYNLCEECEQLNSEIEFHPHKNFILIRNPESTSINTGYSYDCITRNLETHQKFGTDSFTFTIELLNSGNQLWPISKTILKCKKEVSTIFCNKYLLPSIDMNETVKVDLIFENCKKIPKGEYLCYVQFFINDKIIRGPIKIKVFIE